MTGGRRMEGGRIEERRIEVEMRKDGGRMLEVGRL